MQPENDAAMGEAEGACAAPLPAALIESSRRTTIICALTIEVGAKDGVVIGERADRVAWAADAWRIWTSYALAGWGDERKLASVDEVEIRRKPLAKNIVLVTLVLTFVIGDAGISEAEAKRQFWTLVEGAWSSVRRAA
jgi:hypothetical protein